MAQNRSVMRCVALRFKPPGRLPALLITSIAMERNDHLAETFEYIERQ